MLVFNLMIGVMIVMPRDNKTARVAMNAPVNQLGTSSNMMVNGIIFYLTEYYRSKISEIAILGNRKAHRMSMGLDDESRESEVELEAPNIIRSAVRGCLSRDNHSDVVG